MAVTVKVRLEIEITESGNFGDEWSLADIRKTGLREALETLDKIMLANKDKLKITGAPKAISYVHTEDLK